MFKVFSSVSKQGLITRAMRLLTLDNADLEQIVIMLI